MNETIENIKKEYTVSMYNNLDKIDDNLLQLSISDKLFLEMLLLRIRQETIHFASQRKKAINNQEQKLILEIQTLETNPSLSQLTDLIQDKKQELNENSTNKKQQT